MADCHLHSFIHKQRYHLLFAMIPFQTSVYPRLFIVDLPDCNFVSVGLILNKNNLKNFSSFSLLSIF